MSLTVMIALLTRPLVSVSAVWSADEETRVWNFMVE